MDATVPETRPTRRALRSSGFTLKRNILLGRRSKAVFYLLSGPLMAINGWLYRHLRAPPSEPAKVHLGPGKKLYADGWININANMFTGKRNVWVDLRNRLPSHDSTVDAMYSHHMVEHLPDLQFRFAEIYRCLKPSGVYRVGGPNGDSAIKKFIENDKARFNEYPAQSKQYRRKAREFPFLAGLNI